MTTRTRSRSLDTLAVAHSLGIGEARDRWPATFEAPAPVFDGAVTSNATSMSRATAPGSSTSGSS